MEGLAGAAVVSSGRRNRVRLVLHLLAFPVPASLPLQPTPERMQQSHLEGKDIFSSGEG